MGKGLHPGAAATGGCGDEQPLTRGSRRGAGRLGRFIRSLYRIFSGLASGVRYRREGAHLSPPHAYFFDFPLPP